jgi:ATP-dependent phosphoenolpyruvate carboxykinase
VAALYEDALVYESGSAITASGALSAYSGAKTGRSPSDKRIVKEPSSENEVWWGPVNKPISPEVSCHSCSRETKRRLQPDASSPKRKRLQPPPGAQIRGFPPAREP